MKCMHTENALRCIEIHVYHVAINLNCAEFHLYTNPDFYVQILSTSPGVYVGRTHKEEN